MAKHLNGVILVVANGEKTFRPQQTLRVAVRIEVRDVSDVVTARLQPVGERKFPEEPLAGTGGKRCVQDLAVSTVRSIEADLNVRSPIPLICAVVVKRELARPAIVRLPGGVGTLENEVGRAIVAHD